MLENYQTVIARIMSLQWFQRMSEHEQKLFVLIGLGEETGEVLKVYKKFLYKTDAGLNKDALIEELGDVLWHVAAICNLEDISLDDVLNHAITKAIARNKDES